MRNDYRKAAKCYDKRHLCGNELCKQKMYCLLQMGLSSALHVLRKKTLCLDNGTSFMDLTQDDLTLIANHINSVKKPPPDGKSPYDLVDDGEDIYVY